MIDYRDNNNYTVYIHIIPKSITKYDYDKYYVGITKCAVNKRWSNGYGYRKNIFFFRAIQKYGWDNIEHYIFASSLTKDEALNMEICLISLLHSNNQLYGYNLTNGGEGTLGVTPSPEYRKLKSEQMKGENNPFYHCHHTEETRKKMSENHYDCSGGNNVNARKIYQFSTDRVYIASYDSIRDAAKALNVSDSMGYNARNHIIGYGYIWAFEEDIIVLKDQIILKDSYQLKPSTTKEVFKFDQQGNFIKRYKTCLEAAQDNGISKTAIYSNIRGITKTDHNGYLWKDLKGITVINDNYYIKEGA